VEDQHSNRTVISLMLEALGVQVETAADGEEALAKAADSTYDLILMDIKMPRMDGYEATRQLRQRGIQTPIVALSAKVFDEQEHHQISMMFDGFLTKPVDSRKLSETLRKFIKRLSDPNDQVSQEETVVIQYEN
jgi:CheY-like chemotaxis protein